VGYDLAAFMPDGTGYFFWSARAATPAVPGAFEWMQDFKYGTTWDFLLDGEATLDLEGPTFSTGECWYAVPYPAVTVTAAVLIVDGEFTVPARNGTWGRIKGLYR
jgi:hypothetical protein